MRASPLIILTGLFLIAVGPAQGQELTDRFGADEPAPAPFAPVTAGATVTAAGATGDVALALVPGPIRLSPEPGSVPQDGFETTGFAQFIASPAGRILRGVVGAGMITGGVVIGDTGGAVLGVAGALPLSAGVFDLCYVSALLGGPIRGEEIREAGRDGG